MGVPPGSDPGGRRRGHSDGGDDRALTTVHQIGRRLWQRDPRDAPHLTVPQVRAEVVQSDGYDDQRRRPDHGMVEMATRCS